MSAPFQPLKAGLAVLIVLAASVSSWYIAPAVASIADVKINEVESNPATVDFVEFYNAGATDVDLSGYVFKDNDDTHVYTFGPGTIILAGGYLVREEVAGGLTFGLSSADSARFFEPGGTVLLDSYTWTAHAATTYGRCPDGTGAFVTTTSVTKGGANDCSSPVKINEVKSTGADGPDFIELFNPGAASADVSGLILKDSSDADAFTIPNGTSIAAGGFLAYEQTAGQFIFGLGSADSARLFAPDGTTQLDSYSWTAHVNSHGRCPNGTGAFTAMTPTKGITNGCGGVGSPVKLNEVKSTGADGPDFIELFNPSASAADVSGLILKDNSDADAFTIPNGTSIAAGGFLAYEQTAGQFIFGLGSADSARLFAAGGTTLLDSYSWTAHVNSHGRCPDGTGAFVTGTPTKGAANACPGVISVEPWPGGATIAPADGANVLGGNMSGLMYQPSGNNQRGVLWAVKNGPGTLFRLVWNGSIWTPDTANGWGAGKLLRYTDGSGDADAEGVTFTDAGPAGGIYVSTERNNANNAVSRNSILLFDPGAVGSTLTATREWNVTAAIPATGPNLGLEAIAWIPDAFLVAEGFLDESTNQPYDPSGYANHGSGLFFVGVEQGGAIHAFALNHGNGSFARIATINSGFTGVMGLDFDRELGRFWAVCDDTCMGRSVHLEINDEGRFEPIKQFDRPSGMPNLNNEGFAVASQMECVSNRKPAFWTDDGNTAGNAIRAGTVDCQDADADGFTGAQETDSAGTPPGNQIGSNPANAASTPEVCDGLDNDLNEGIDEGYTDTDGDRARNCVDADDDNDGQSDADETVCGSDPVSASSRSLDTDGDGRPNCVDTDDDNDGRLDAGDNCSLVANSNQADFDRDGSGDACDSQTGPPVDKDQCKNDGWKRFDTPRRFKNQGDCNQYVNTGK